MTGTVFVDTNVLVYRKDASEPEKQSRAQEWMTHLWNEHAGRVSAFGVFNDQSGTEDVIVVAEVDSQDPDERVRIADEIRQAINRGSAIVVRHVHIVNAPWIVKTSSGKTARLANREKYLKEVGQPVS